MKTRLLIVTTAILALLLQSGSGVRAGDNIDEITTSGSSLVTAHWDDRTLPIRYKIYENVAAGLDLATIKPEVDAAFNDWENLPDNILDFAWAGRETIQERWRADGKNVLVFDPNPLDLGGYVAATVCSTLTADFTVVDSSDGTPGNGLGYIRVLSTNILLVPVGVYPAGTTVDCDIIFDTVNQDFGVTGTPGGEDVRGISAHEIGHWFMLAHTPLPDATMFPFTDANPDGDGIGGASTLEWDDISSVGHIYKDANYDTNHGTITGHVTLDGQPGDGVHVTALRASDLKPVAGRLSISRYMDPADVVNGADFAAEGAAFYRLDGLPADDYYVCAEWFDGTDEKVGTRFEAGYNSNVFNSNVAMNQAPFTGELNYLPQRFECHNTNESADGGDGSTAGAAADNPDEATLVTVTAGNVVPGVDIDINLDPATGKTDAQRQNPTGVAPVDLTAYSNLSLILLDNDTNDDDWWVLRFAAADLPTPPYNVLEGIWAKFGRSDEPYLGAMLLADTNNPNSIQPMIVHDSRRLVTGWDGGNTGITEVIDIRDHFNVTINQARDIFMAVKMPESPSGITSGAEGYFVVAKDTAFCTNNPSQACDTDGECAGPATCGISTGKSLFTVDDFQTFFVSDFFDVPYRLRTETAPPVMVNGASPAVLQQGETGTVVTITGAGFQSGADVDFLAPAFGAALPSGVTATNVTFVNASTLEVTVDVDLAAPLGILDVQVTNPEVIIPNRARLMGITVPADTDNDGVPDPFDCAPSDIDLWSAPGDIGATILATEPGAGTAQFDWTAPGDTGGNSVTLVYDVIRGLAATIQSSSGGDLGTCLVDDNGTTMIQETGTPGPGEIWTYFMSAGNSCGPGPHGEEFPTGLNRDDNPGNCGGP